MISDYKDFPPQKLPLSKKTEEWKKKSVDGIIARGSGFGYFGGDGRKSTMLTLYGLYNSQYDEADLKYVTNPFNVEDGFPAKTQDMNIVRPKIDLLLGEESKRPLMIKVIETNDSTVSELQEKKKQLLLQYVEKVLGVRKDEQGNVMTPPEIEKYLTSTYKTIAENVAYHSLNYLREKLRLDDEFLRCFKDLLISSEEIMYVGAYNGEPYAERINPVYCDYDTDPDIDRIEDGDWFLYTIEMTPAAIYDRYYDMLDEETLDKILDYANEGLGSVTSARPDQVRNKSIMYKDKLPMKISGGTYDNSYGAITLFHAVWKSYKKIGFVFVQDPNTGELVQEMVDETYKPSKGEKVEWDWIEEVWEGYRVGEDIYFGMGPIDYQIRSKDNPASVKLPYYGIVYSKDNSVPKSLLAIMKPLQYMYIILWYRLELALARDKGKVITMDITQIPKGLGVDVNQWMHYLSALGVNFVNPYDEGWDVPGREGGKPAQFNQITALDLTMSKSIADYIGLMTKIEEMLGEISGVTKAREGQIGPYELANNVNRSTMQSAHITEPLFWAHNNFKNNVYEGLINIAKNVWGDSNKENLHYIFGDTERIFLKITDDFIYSDIDVFVSDSTKESQDLELVRQLLQPAMQNGATLLDAAEILTTENMSDVKRKLSDIERQHQKQIQQQQQMQMQIEQAKVEQEKAKLQLDQEKLVQEEQDSIRTNMTKIEVAKIQADAKLGDGNYEIEAAKLQADMQKEYADLELKQKELDEEIRKNKAQEEIKKQEVEVKKKQASKPKTTTTK